MKPLMTWLAFAISSAAVLPSPARAAGAALSFDREDAPDLAAVRGKIQAKDYRGALAELRQMKPTADVNNLMGYSLRKSGDAGQALVYYEKALEIDPAHKETLEYLGELYVETGQLDKAHEKADLLHRICPGGCEESADLDRAIAQAAPGSPTSGGAGGWR